MLAAEGVQLLDTRTADDFERGFIPGSVNIGLNGQFAVWVGTLIDIRKKILLITEPGKERETVLRLARVGYENVIGYLEGGVEAYEDKLEVVKSISADKVQSELENGAKVLDVRKPGEWNAGHLKKASFLPLSDFPTNIEDLDRNLPYIIHCGGGYRSMTAISIMKNFGFKNLVNVAGGFAPMQHAGLEIISEEANG